MHPRSYYRTLNIPFNASEEEIRQAYKTMALRWHPDRHPDDTENATRRFLEVQEAYRMLMPGPYPSDSVLSSSIHQRSESMSTYQSGSYFSASASSLGSFIHISASSMNSLVTPASTIKSSTPSYKSYVSPQRNGRNNQAPVYRRPQYAKDDHSGQTYSSPFSTFGRTHARHSSEDLRQYSAEWANYTPPSLPKYSTTRPSRDSHSFTIIPPLRNPRPTRPPALSWDNYRLHEQHHQTHNFRSLGIGPAKEWIYSLSLTLEELLSGKHCSFSLARNLLTGKCKTVILEVDIPPGCREGMRILCRGVGHERKDGSRQDVAFIIEELAHDHFSRRDDDLILDVRIPWDDSLRHQAADFLVEGVDRKKYSFRIDYPHGRAFKGKYIIQGAGMPIRSGGKVVGRGNLVIQWEIIPHRPSLLKFMKRFMNLRR